MLFNTIEFWLFFAIVLLLVYILPHRGQNRVLLIASYVFYAAWDWRFLSLILISTLVDYFVAPFAVPGNTGKIRKLALLSSVVVNLGILGFFKYYDFFVSSFAGFCGLTGDTTNSLLLNLVLPVGISFYTFQTMSYTFDVYAGKITPVKSFWDFALYVAFFPQLVAGPIERGSRLIPQIVNPRNINIAKLESACHLIAWGLFKKVFVADTLAHVVNTVFAGKLVTGFEVYAAMIGFSLQIYCDFSGYSDIARGVARLMGIELMLNFNLPYFSKNPSDFWRRWHISLSTWLKDYLYIPLGGNRRGKFLTCCNIMVTMILGGLWHGARYNFILWGLFHGIVLVIYRFSCGFDRLKNSSESLPKIFIKMFLMFHIILFGWLLFRVENVSQLSRMVLALFTSWTSMESSIGMFKYMAPAILPLLFIQLCQLRSRDLEFINKKSWPVRACFFGICISTVLLLNRGSSIPFIYFQF